MKKKTLKIAWGIIAIIMIGSMIIFTLIPLLGTGYGGTYF